MSSVNSEYRILKVWPFWVDGIKYHDQYLADKMLEDNVYTHFICPDYTPPNYSAFSSESDKNSTYNVSFLKSFFVFGKPFPYDFFGVISKVRLFKPDVVHFFGISNFITVVVLLALFFSNYKGKIVFNDHSDPNERKKGLKARFYYGFFAVFFKIFIRGKYKIIVPDDSSFNEIVRRYGSGVMRNLTIIPLGYDERIFCNSNPSRGKKAFVLGFAGKINEAKKLERLVDASLCFDESVLDIKIAGLNLDRLSQYQQSLLDYVKSTGRNNIHLTSFISAPSELSDFYAGLDLAVFPGSISITTLEATGCGTPIVLYNSISGLDHRVSNGRGLLFDTQQELVSCIDFFLNAKEGSGIDHNQIASNSREFSWSSLKHEYYNIYGFKG
ncbi:glycosyltransferase family 4 protein [Neptuniibacter halophilus]|uniref:glycosyltransferase family 4 protein n=1 Tax=Neptuniibacter halophilus TaxID=651666 RepID=UPI0025723161|nr:glycosyltransferase family 4 protein [Neptuniibacter halophilus]